MDVVRALMEGGADIDKTMDGGYTPLYVASVQGHVDVVKVILEEGADIRRAANDGSTPRSVATVPEIIEILDLAAQSQHNG